MKPNYFFVCLDLFLDITLEVARLGVQIYCFVLSIELCTNYSWIVYSY